MTVMTVFDETVVATGIDPDKLVVVPTVRTNREKRRAESLTKKVVRDIEEQLRIERARRNDCE
jgi:hypothetical protein